MSLTGRCRAAVLCASIGLALVAIPADAAAQDIASTTLASSASSPLVDLAPLNAAAVQTAQSEVIATQAAPAVGPRGRGAILPLYVGFATLQMLDVHSTLRAVGSGVGVEQNPLMKGLADRPAAMIALKGGVAASTIFLADRLHRHNRVGAMIMMAALNSVYATIVAHNYSIR